jgi:hypothetical protein
MFWNIVGGLIPPVENLTSLLVLFKNILIWLLENKKGDFSRHFLENILGNRNFQWN